MDVLGAPSTVEASRDLGRSAVAATLHAAREMPLSCHRPHVVPRVLALVRLESVHFWR